MHSNQFLLQNVMLNVLMGNGFLRVDEGI